jgi:hypothetical protein
MGKEAVLLLRIRMTEKEDANKIIHDTNVVKQSIAEKFPQFTTIFIEPDNLFNDYEKAEES